jgi:hypothetical protein
MSVETGLGLSAALADQIITKRWAEWTQSRPALAGVDAKQLRGWMRSASVQDANEALYELAVLASVDGGDDTEAAQLLAWCLLPSACRLAHEFADVDPAEVDHVVASQLWIEIRTYNWRSCTRVTGTICANLRRSVLREWSLDPDRRPRLRVVASGDLLAQLGDAPSQSDLDAHRALCDVLDWGVANGVIEAVDRAMLLQMVEISVGDPKRRSPRRSLLAAAVVAAPVFGVSPRTVRRRSRHALDALAARAPELAELLEPLAS